MQAELFRSIAWRSSASVRSRVRTWARTRGVEQFVGARARVASRGTSRRRRRAASTTRCRGGSRRRRCRCSRVKTRSPPSSAQRPAELRPDALGELDDVVDAAVALAHDGELVRAQARGGVAHAEGLAQREREREQHLVARSVPERLVDHREAVEVDQQQRDGRGPVAPAPGEREVEAVEREGAVGEPRERIVQRRVARQPPPCGCAQRRRRGRSRPRPGS